MNIDVKKIAKLSFLKIEENEVASFEKKMSDIIAMVEQLPATLDFDAKPKVEDAMTLRKDQQLPSLSREKLLAGAPRVEAGCIVVPKTVE